MKTSQKEKLVGVKKIFKQVYSVDEWLTGLCVACSVSKTAVLTHHTHTHAHTHDRPMQNAERQTPGKL